MSSTSASFPTPAPLRQDASLIGLVGVGHMVSHFSQLLLAPLFPWLKDAFQVSYTELGFLMTVFFVVSCAVQAGSGFLVDRFSPRPILFAGLGLIGLGAFGYASAPNYAAMVASAAVVGVGNGVFHPVNFTLLNRKVSDTRLGHAYSAHGITGSLGWALAPAMVVPLALAFSWRVALAAAGCFAFAVLALLWVYRSRLTLARLAPAHAPTGRSEHSLAFLRIPAVWMCFAFFLWWAVTLSAVQSFAPEAARQLHGVPLTLAAMCVTVYMLASACGTLCGGFLVTDPSRCERIVASGFVAAAVVALTLGFADVPGAMVPALFGVMGFATGIAGPSRDLLVKRSTPENASGRVYGVVYSGLDIGQAAAPLVFGMLMDHQRYQAVWVGIVLMQCMLIASAFNVRRARRTTAIAA